MGLTSVRGGRRAPWIRIRNRRERLGLGVRGEGARCEWLWTSDLHVAHVFPALGRALLRRTLRDWPIQLADAPRDHRRPPQVAFLIGHRGMERLPLLSATLASLAAQEGVACEYIVVEQSPAAELSGLLPAWVRHVHLPPPQSGMPFSRAWAFNVAARLASAPVLVFHDGDFMAPAAYAAEVWSVWAGGARVIDLKRFIFELSADQNDEASRGALSSLRGPLVRVMQNAHGGTLAVDHEAFLGIGGFDETFVGWGGEDNEFWERASTLETHGYGWLPFVHLWHPGQAGKGNPEAPAIRRFGELSRVPVTARIETLRGRCFGDPRGPAR